MRGSQKRDQRFALQAPLDDGAGLTAIRTHHVHSLAARGRLVAAAAGHTYTLPRVHFAAPWRKKDSAGLGI